MAEVIGAISAAITILETTLRIADRLAEAKDKKAWAVTVDEIRRSLRSLRDTIAVVKTEKELQTKKVVGDIIELTEHADEMQDLLSFIEDANFATRFFRGKNKRDELTTLASKIASAKSALTIKISSANVGLTELANKTLAIHSGQLERVEKQLQQILDGFTRFSIAAFIDDKDPDDEGYVSLTPEELVDLGLKEEDGIEFTGSSRVIAGNLTLEQAIMINGNIGIEGFIEPKHTKILDNIAKGYSVMLNASQSQETFDKVLADRLKVIETLANSGALGREQANLALQGNRQSQDVDRVREGRSGRDQARSLRHKIRNTA